MAGHYPKPIDELANLFSLLPGIGKRTAERMTLNILDWDAVQLKTLAGLLDTLKERVKQCRTCGNLTEADNCDICLNPNRDHRLICVVETARQVPVIERCGRFHGVYHILGGRLNPLDDIDIAKLSVDALYRRIPGENVSEVILATSPDVEGEATAIYLADELTNRFGVQVTRISLGVPIGSDLSFADAATMGTAIDARRVMR